MVTSPRLLDFTFFRGRVALAFILRALGIRPGDRVAIQAFTCVAVPEALLSVGAHPIYVDTEPGSVTMDPADLEQKLTEPVRAVVIQHTFGMPADLDRLLPLAAARNVPVIGDCAHTISSLWDGQPVGAFGAASFYSFEASKPVFIGIGGSAVANDPPLREQFTRLYPQYRAPAALTQGQLLGMWMAHRLAYRPSAYWAIRGLYRRLVAAGVLRGNYNEIDDTAGPAEDFALSMGAVQRRLLRPGLRTIDQNGSHRRWVADGYRQSIQGSAIRHLTLPPKADPVFGRYPLVTKMKDAIVAAAPSARVEVADFYSTPVHGLHGQHLERVQYRTGSCPYAEDLCRSVISLPTGHLVGPSAVQRAADFLNSFAAP